MTDEELAEIEKACAEATPRPWKWSGPCLNAHGQNTPGTPAKFPWEVMAHAEDDEASKPSEADKRFIADARQWIPALLAEVKRLRDAVRQAGSLFVLEQRRHVETGQFRQTEQGWETTLSHSARIRLRSLQEAEAEGARREREKLAQELAQEVEQWPPAAFLEGEPVVFQSVIVAAIRARGET